MIELDIRDLLLSVTNFCLGSCVYCNLKSLKAFSLEKEIEIKDIERLLADSLLDGLKNIHITGGEPILTPKTYEVFRLIKEYHPNIRINMPVSGFFPYTTERYLKKLWTLTPQLRVDVSLDGPKNIHEKTRGKGSFKQVMKTIELLNETAPKDKLQLQLTLMESNYRYIRWVYDLANSMGRGFYVTFPHFGTRFGHEEDRHHIHKQKFIDTVEQQLQSSWLLERPLNRRIWTEQKSIWEDKETRFDCDMGKHSIDVDSFGNVYPCMVYLKNQIFGNIRNESLSSMFKKQSANTIFENIANRTCQPCVMPCCAWKRNLTINGKAIGLD